MSSRIQPKEIQPNEIQPKEMLPKEMLPNEMLPKEIENLITEYKYGLDHSMYFQANIKIPLQLRAVNSKYHFLKETYEYDVYDDDCYMEKYLRAKYVGLEEDFEKVIKCKCCSRHQTNRPTDLHNSKLYTYRITFKDDSENDIKLYNHECKCICRTLARKLVRIVKTNDRVNQETLRNIFFFEATKRVTKGRLAAIEDYEYHCIEFPDIVTEEERDTPLRKKVELLFARMNSYPNDDLNDSEDAEDNNSDDDLNAFV